MDRPIMAGNLHEREKCLMQKKKCVSNTKLISDEIIVKNESRKV
jgi:hypothetical protein